MTGVLIVVALVGSLLYLGYAITVRDACQIPLLASGAVVLGLVFGAIAVVGARATWRSSVRGSDARAFGHAIIGGFASLVAAGCLRRGDHPVPLRQTPAAAGTGARAERRAAGPPRRPLLHSAGASPPSSRGLGRHPFKVEIRGSNPLGGTPAVS